MSFPPYYYTGSNPTTHTSTAHATASSTALAIPSILSSASPKSSLENIMSMHLKHNHSSSHSSGGAAAGDEHTKLPASAAGAPPQPPPPPPPPPPPVAGGPHQQLQPPVSSQFTFTYPPTMMRKPAAAYGYNYITPEQDSLILSLRKQQNKSWGEIAQIAKLDSEHAARLRYHQLTDEPTEPLAWDKDDVDCLKELLETGERAKWKFISAELTKERNKRITAIACQKKFKEMFGVAESSSVLGSSLCYVVSPNGWNCLDQTKPISSSSMQSAYSDEI